MQCSPWPCGAGEDYGEGFIAVSYCHRDDDVLRHVTMKRVGGRLEVRNRIRKRSWNASILFV